MKQFLLVFCFVLLNLGLSPSGVAAAPAPLWELTDLEGRTRSLEDWRGKWVLLKMSTTQCPNCSAEMVEMAKVQGRLEALGVEVVDIYVLEKRRSVKKYLSKNNFTFRPTTLYDRRGALVREYGVSIVPHLVLIDPQGQIAWEGQFTPAEKLIHVLESKIQPARANAH